MEAAIDSAKRKRSPSFSSSSALPPAKAPKTNANQLSINYLARQTPEDLPLLTKDDSLPNLLVLLSQYSNVLDRHESLASNLGARPLGPILIKRFERCFDAPPKIVTSHQKGSISHPDDSSHHITWLEVIEFARSHPGQFTLATFSEGRRVCQFYYPQKQLRVQISEEDYLFINSGRCQELIPPLPIWEDEEKEVGACDVLEAKLKELTNAADIVAARTRQLSHRLKGRRAAILERRAEGGSGTPAKASAPQTTTAPPSSGSGFNPANASNGKPGGENELNPGAFAAVRSELLRHFESLPHNQNIGRQSRDQSMPAIPGTFPPSRFNEQIPPDQSNPGIRATSTNSSLSPGPSLAPQDPISYYTSDNAPLRQSTSNSAPTPAQRPSSSSGLHGQSASQTPSRHNFSRPLPPALESSQPFRPLCQAHMDSLPRGHRVIPPCDRCRRLRMDCVKNLTSCAGCTKKHARCHWREVSRDEMGALDSLMDGAYTYTGAEDQSLANGSEAGDHHPDDDEEDDSNPLEDLEALDGNDERRSEAREDEDDVQYVQLDEDAHSSRVRHRTLSGVYPDSCDAPRTSKEKKSQDTVHGEGQQKEAPPDEADGRSPSWVPLPSAPHGGFRAVNQELTGGAALNNTSWRTA